MKISVVIPSYNGAKKLPNIINSLKEQTFKGFEVVVAIDGSVDDSVEVAQNYLSICGIEGEVYWVENKGRSGIRNFGASKAKGEFLVFFDDDMRPFSSCLQNYYTLLSESADTVFVGQILEEEKDGDSDIDRFHQYLVKRWNNTQSEGLLDSPYLSAANFAISKQNFNLLNGFNESLTDGEDFEFACRLFKNNFRLHFSSGSAAYHDDSFTIYNYSKRQREYRLADKKIDELHPEFFNSKNEMSPLKKFFFKIFGLPKLITWADAGKFTFLPVKIRFKLYDLILTGSSI